MSDPAASSGAAFPRTLVQKIWDDHVVLAVPGAPTVIGIDLHLVHEVTSPQAFEGLRRRGLGVRHPERTVATADHSTPTHDRSLPILDQQASFQLAKLAANCQEFGIPLYALGSDRQGIVHVIGPELGLTQPGMTIVCGDSHTATHGAFGALAFGIGTSEVEMVLATQTLLQRPLKTYEVRVDGRLAPGVTSKDIILNLISRIGALAFGIGTSEVEMVLATQTLLQRPLKTYEVRVDGRLAPGVTSKDIILNLISRIGVGGGTGHVFEYTGEGIRALSMEQRMTICNMSIEGGARAGLIAPDDTTFEYVAGRPHAPKDAAFDAAVDRWRQLPSDEGAVYEKSITIDAAALEPMITYGTNPGMGMGITARVPRPEDASDDPGRRTLERALAYMDLAPGEPLLGHRVDTVFIGSCTNSRISDLRSAAALLEGQHVAEGVRVMVVPGSQTVKAQAEREGLADIFRAAGADWREAGCSMCIAMNGDQGAPGEYIVSTSNRNFEGRQGKGARTFLASPLTAAATALAGVVTDPRPLVERVPAAAGAQ